jgi:hypothetical protein
MLCDDGHRVEVSGDVRSGLGYISPKIALDHFDVIVLRQQLDVERTCMIQVVKSALRRGPYRAGAVSSTRTHSPDMFSALAIC